MNRVIQQFELTDKIAIVTGAGSGIGREFAQVYAEAGAFVISTDRDEDRAQETADLIAAGGGKASAMCVDVADAGAVEDMAGAVAADHGRVHILVNNAGVTTRAARLHDIPVEAWNDVIGINLSGVFLCSRAIIPLMLEAGGGSIINISSILGLVGHYPDFPMVNICYSAAKAGVIGITRQTAAEYAKDNIRVNAIAPGWHGGTRLGDVTRRHMSNETISKFEDSVAGGTPMNRRGMVDELSGLALYLASDASSYMTGQVIANDGGWTAV
ncbi:MAG: SDR family NAD(P)-dependent oxidoreductase [Rhodospirillales bacterium]|jgi:NAD(P)-dependent dehydrogenase (short-subunit alcohol dehydrogenase family)|nr:SDR family NAD(P)-dependent oxidoreductase [Rhodospirillales bacterium]MDP6646184.1 SDR family NAD(P)-dependent oxidoreductase [Rhodospirillales bacterium]MDP6841288.1 SDR family NAD(P)-dependent oxidoreductase [Rhodospirillales bacterium]|tara:strand:- start:37 stop:846 length:810 start_codon:yes stop_codon:yes gene_type:complete